MSGFNNKSKKEYQLPVRVITTLSAGLIFLISIPFILIWLGPELDAYFSTPGIGLKPHNEIFILLISIPGFILAMWSIITQIMIGKGTPIPLMATQKLIIIGPFKFSRNPMSFGTICMYLGISLYMNSLFSFGIVCIFSCLLICYIKLIEKKELTERFGNEYLEYKKSTPFLIPKINHFYK
ncbi:MAG: isoprenylcysteine carboxylmethyltransferase family protein [Anaerolineaceae bacterium]|nr:isoprenylcysteine carboxylmethyltransferase family protein [Anaerolineaceae bacterium]